MRIVLLLLVLAILMTGCATYSTLYFQLDGYPERDRGDMWKAFGTECGPYLVRASSNAYFHCYRPNPKEDYEFGVVVRVYATSRLGWFGFLELLDKTFRIAEVEIRFRSDETTRLLPLVDVSSFRSTAAQLPAATFYFGSLSIPPGIDSITVVVPITQPGPEVEGERCDTLRFDMHRIEYRYTSIWAGD